MDTEAEKLCVELFAAIFNHTGPFYIDSYTKTLIRTDWQNLILKWANKDFSSEKVEELLKTINELESDISRLKEGFDND